MNKYEVIRDALTAGRDALTAGANEIERLRKENEKLKQHNQLLRAVARKAYTFINRATMMDIDPRTADYRSALDNAIDGGALDDSND